MTLAQLERLPPHDIEAEEAVIASLMVDSQAMLAVQGIVKAGDFFREKNGWVYDACVALWNRDEVVNQITVAHELASRDQLQEVGGQTFLADVIRRLPTSIGAEFYARIVKRDAMYRGLIHAAKWNLLEAASGAYLVLLGGPLADQPEWLKAFGPEVRFVHGAGVPVDGGELAVMDNKG